MLKKLTAAIPRPVYATHDEAAKAAERAIDALLDNIRAPKKQKDPEALSLGDVAGSTAWTKIFRAIEDLRSQKPAAGEPLN